MKPPPVISQNEVIQSRRQHVIFNVMRKTTVFIGLGLILLAVLAPAIGLSTSGGLSKGRLLFILIAGVVIIFAMLSRQRIVQVYSAAGTIFLTSILFVFVIELGATIILRARSMMNPSAEHPNISLPYYKATDWGVEYWQEFEASRTMDYYPYVIWRRQPFENSMIHVNADHLRVVPNTDCASNNAYTVFIFGGSTVWGTGAPDWATIPAYLQPRFETLMRRPICIKNFGESGFVYTQSTIQLILELQKGHIPDLIIFYDGINDIFASYQNGEAGLHQNVEEIAEKMEDSSKHNNPLVEWLLGLNSVSLFVPEEAETTPERPEFDTEQLADSIVQNYRNNYQIVGAIAQEYDFDYFYFWQPVLFVTNKRLTQEEQEVLELQQEKTPGIDELFAAVYSQIEALPSQYVHFKNLTSVLDRQTTQLWIDAWHITPPGNILVADAMLEALQPLITLQEQ